MVFLIAAVLLYPFFRTVRPADKQTIRETVLFHLPVQEALEAASRLQAKECTLVTIL